MMELRKGGAGAGAISQPRCTQSMWQSRRGQQEEVDGAAPMRTGLHLLGDADNLVVASCIRAFHVILRLQPKVNKVLEGRLREVEVAALIAPSKKDRLTSRRSSVQSRCHK